MNARQRRMVPHFDAFVAAKKEEPTNTDEAPDADVLAMLQDTKEEDEKITRLAEWSAGMRVQVEIAKPDEWTKGAVAHLNGATGVIDEVSRRDHPCSGNILVRFDKEIKGWHSHQLPIERHWFETWDLKKL